MQRSAQLLLQKRFPQLHLRRLQRRPPQLSQYPRWNPLPRGERELLRPMQRSAQLLLQKRCPRLHLRRLQRRPPQLSQYPRWNPLPRGERELLLRLLNSSPR
jgi:hypothetical protein